MLEQLKCLAAVRIDMTYNPNPGPDEVLDYFHSGVHTGRGTGLDKAISAGFIREFEAHRRIAPHSEDLAFSLFMDLGSAVRNVDLVIGPSRSHGTPRLGMVNEPPADVWLAAEWKSIMTEHGKAKRNRRGDFDAHAHGVAQYRRDAVTLGLCVINASDNYFSYTAKAERSHGDGIAKATACVRELDGLRVRQDANEAGLDALCLPVVVADNIDFAAARYLDKKPAPAAGEVRSWDTFVEKAAQLVYERFLRS